MLIVSHSLHWSSMECSSLIQSLDSLWFFNSIFNPSNVTEEKAVSQKDSQDHTSIKCPGFGELAAEEMVKVDKEIMEEEEEAAVGMKSSAKGSESEKKEEKRVSGRRSSRRRRRRKAREESKRRLFSERRRMVLGENFDTDNHENERESSWSNNYNVERKKGYCYDHILLSGFKIGSQFGTRMPPLSDGNAMKEHLKHWAYAVACTVR